MKHFPGSEGQVAKSARMAFGALYIQTAEGLTDVKTRQHIRETSYAVFLRKGNVYNRTAF